MPSTFYKDIIPATWSINSYKLFQTKLLTLEDKKYKDFNSRITNTTFPMIGIRVPILKRIAKNIKNTNIYKYLEVAQINYFEETILEGIVISFIDNYDEFLKYFKIYLNHIDNWATCDLAISNFKIIKNNKDKFIKQIDSLLHNNNPNYVRVGLVALLNYYRNDIEYKDYIFNELDKIDNNSYYVKMAIAWLVSYLFIEYREDTLKYLENNNLDSFTQNKAISKIRESLRVRKEDKDLVIKYKKNTTN